MPANLPGFYFDPEKGKYFKIQPYQQAPARSKYTKDAIKQEKVQSGKRRRQENIDRQIASWKPVRRWKKIDDLSRFIYGREIATTTSRPTSKASTWVAGLSVGVSDIVRKVGGVRYDCPGRVTSLAWDPTRGTLLTAVECQISEQNSRLPYGPNGYSEGGEGFIADAMLQLRGPGLSDQSYTIRPRTPSKVCVQSDMIVFAEAQHLSIIPLDEFAYDDELSDGDSSEEDTSELSPFFEEPDQRPPLNMQSLTDRHGSFNFEDEILDIALRPGCDQEHVEMVVGTARGCFSVSKSLSAADHDLSSINEFSSAKIHLDLADPSRAIVAVDWLDRNVMTGGRRDGNVYLYDVRAHELQAGSRGTWEDHKMRSVLRLRHPTCINSLHVIDSVRLVTAGLQSRMSMYDLRYAPQPTRSQLFGSQGNGRPSSSSQAKPLLPVVDYHGYDNECNRQLAVAVSKPLNVIAAAAPKGDVKLFDLHRGTEISVPKVVKQQSCEPTTPVTAMHFLDNPDELDERGRGMSLFLGRRCTVEEWTWL